MRYNLVIAAKLVREIVLKMVQKDNVLLIHVNTRMITTWTYDFVYTTSDSAELGYALW